MRFLLDTNVWIHYLKNVSSPVSSRLQKTPASEVAVCSVVWAELLHGARKYERRDDRVARVERTLAPYNPCPLMMRRLDAMRSFAMNWNRAAK